MGRCVDQNFKQAAANSRKFPVMYFPIMYLFLTIFTPRCQYVLLQHRWMYIATLQRKEPCTGKEVMFQDTRNFGIQKIKCQNQRHALTSWCSASFQSPCRQMLISENHDRQGKQILSIHKFNCLSIISGPT